MEISAQRGQGAGCAAVHHSAAQQLLRATAEVLSACWSSRALTGAGATPCGVCAALRCPTAPLGPVHPSAPWMALGWGPRECFPLPCAGAAAIRRAERCYCRGRHHTGPPGLSARPCGKVSWGHPSDTRPHQFWSKGLSLGLEGGGMDRPFTVRAILFLS